MTLSETVTPVNLTGVPPERAMGWLRTMSLIRQFETVAEPLVMQGRIPGGMHSAIGQEAVAAGVVSALADSDIVTGTHRSHHITLAKGLTPRSVMAELFGKVTGCVGGRGGHMHLADISRGHFGSNGIVGAGLGVAMGAALASSVEKRGQVAVGFFGDGGSNIGRVWEFVNLAALWQLPLIVVCENNLYAVETPVGSATAGGSISRRAEGFGLPVATVDGQDVAAMYAASAVAVTRARAGEGPTFIEAMTYRHGGHDVGDRETYRTKEEVESWRERSDPLARLITSLRTTGLVTAQQLLDVQADVEQVVADSVEFAEASAYPDPATLLDGVTAMDLRIRGNL